MRKVLVTAVLAASLVIVLAVPAAASDHTINGSLVITSGLAPTGVTNTQILSCDGSGTSDGFSDLTAGAAVKVKNEKDKTIGVGSLKSGHYNDSLDCIMKFTVKVPDANTYQVEVSHRGALVYTKKQMEHQHWKVQLSIDGSSS